MESALRANKRCSKRNSHQKRIEKRTRERHGGLPTPSIYLCARYHCHKVTFEFATATRIIFKSGALADLPKLCTGFGRQALIVTGSATGRAERLADSLEVTGIDCAILPVVGEPTLQDVRRGAHLARTRNFVIGIGGGSAMDAAKAISALATNSGEPLDYVELIGRGKPLAADPLPFITIPTTAGTGAEVTRNAVLGSPEHRVKASLRSPLLCAKIAVVDPSLTFGLPHNVTALSGLDAFTQLIEAYVSIRSNPFTDMLCLEGIRRVAGSIGRAYRNPEDENARESMSYASLLSGLALANSGLGVVHGFAAPLGGMLFAPHGALCAAVLPHGIAMNIRALAERDPNSPALAKYHGLAVLLTGDSKTSISALVPFIRSLCSQLDVQPLSYYGLADEDIPKIAESAMHASSMKANPVLLSKTELLEIAERAF